MKPRTIVALIALPFAAASAAAQSNSRSSDGGDLLLRANAPVTVSAGDSVGTVVVIRGDAAIDGTVRGQLTVIDGTARVFGVVHGDVNVVNGHVDLAPGARVGGAVLLYRSTIGRTADASVAGGIHDEVGISFGARAAWFLWLGFTTMFVVAGLVFAWAAAVPLTESATLVTREPGGTVLTGVLLWLGIPVAAFVCFMTVIGIPLAFVMIALLVPALTVIGYLVSATAVGGALLARAWNDPSESVASSAQPPYAAAVAGVIVLQLFALLPGFGGPIALLAGLVGGGAVVRRVWQRRHPRSVAAKSPNTTIGAADGTIGATRW